MVSQFAIKANLLYGTVKSESERNLFSNCIKLTFANGLFQIQQCHEFKRAELTNSENYRKKKYIKRKIKETKINPYIKINVFYHQ